MNVDIRDAYRRALDDFGQKVHLVRSDQWDLPTPCANWDVYALVNHVVGECRWAPALLAGRTVAEVGDELDGDLLGDDPVKAFDIAAAAAVLAAYEEGATRRVVHLTFGDVSGEEYLTELFADALIHTWDVARAVGLPERLDPELVDACAAWFAEAEASYREAGVIADRRPLPPDADPQDHLLAAWGRGL
ncbi:TIGR03086 family metal-binding protein [Thermopolyspora sp. NPDC052614]|uniref:TIGR03086 family metal-binding protein n=1 Tax=Thermopolyspora sp. NPDC052614 TaxID=3155682 RepID=UPI00341DA501